jgi:AraC family transcriptional activator of pobA
VRKLAADGLSGQIGLDRLSLKFIGMRKRVPANSLYDPRNGDSSVGVAEVRIERDAFEPPRTNCFSIYWIKSGQGQFWADAACHSFQPSSLLFFVPYQYVRFTGEQPVIGERIHFHANFLCVETFHAEVGCSGLLFNDLYNPPVVQLSETAGAQVARLIGELSREQHERNLAYAEASLAHLKLLLILATRLKSPQRGDCRTDAFAGRHPVVAQLSELIEQHYQSLHSPTEYAELLHMTAKTLGRVVREQLGKTLTDLIRERILTRAKWELLHTLKPVKEVARDVGFSDELYFSRLFKKATGCSPSFFRQFETEIRGGSNLSMLSLHAPIQPNTADTDTSLSEKQLATH